MTEPMSTPDSRGLREAVEALAAEFDSNVDWSAGRNNYGDNEAWESAARQARALLAEHPDPVPTPEALTISPATPDADDTPPPAAGDVGLSEVERVSICACPGFGAPMPEDSHVYGCTLLRQNVEHIITARLRADRATRDAASRAEAGERIAQAIEALIYDPTRREAARIAREQARL